MQTAGGEVRVELVKQQSAARLLIWRNGHNRAGIDLDRTQLRHVARALFRAADALRVGP